MKPARVLACATLILSPLALAQHHHAPRDAAAVPIMPRRFERRQTSTSGGGTPTGGGPGEGPTTTTSKETETSTNPPTNTTPTTSPPTPTTSPPTDTTTPPPDTGTPPPPSDTTNTESSTDTTETGTTTPSRTPTTGTRTGPSTSASSPAATQPAAGLSQGTIIGLAVTGGIAGLALIAFIIWKFTQKRFSNFDDDGEPIKWPELQNESHALPVRSTGGAGIGERNADPSGVFSNTTATNSSADLPHDPYGVPPLPPQHDHNIGPYRDDPHQAYYDPYNGPVPQSLGGGAYVSGGGGPGSIRSRSPGPNVPFDDPYAAGRRSPGPGLAYDQGRSSPAPSGYGGMPYDQGRRSPGPAQAYGGGGRRSPGPAQAYGGYDDPYGGQR